MRVTSTDTVTIYVGFRAGYTAERARLEACEAICQEYVDRIGLCVTVTPTRFVYKDGCEPGAAVGLINYPRFPSNRADIRKKALELASLLMLGLKQQRVSVVCSDETIMLEYAE